MSDQKDESITPLSLLENSNYISYFKLTGKLRELLLSIEAAYSLSFSSIISFFLTWMFKEDPEKFIKFINDFLNVLIGGYFGLLGFIVGAVAIILGLISNKFIDKMQQIDAFNNFLNLCFMYAFAALQNLWVLAELVLIKVIINMPLDFIMTIDVFWQSIVVFFVFLFLLHLPSFNLVYSTYLVKVSLELLFLKYVVEKDKNEDEIE